MEWKPNGCEWMFIIKEKFKKVNKEFWRVYLKITFCLHFSKNRFSVLLESLLWTLFELGLYVVSFFLFK